VGKLRRKTLAYVQRIIGFYWREDCSGVGTSKTGLWGPSTALKEVVGVSREGEEPGRKITGWAELTAGSTWRRKA